MFSDDMFRLIAALPVDDMVWFVFQVLRSSETEFTSVERKDILEQMTQIFSFELDPFSDLLHQISIDYFGKNDENVFSQLNKTETMVFSLSAILKKSHGLEQRLLISWLYGLSARRPVEKSFLLTFQQYIQWHWLDDQSVQLLFGILLRKFDRHGEKFCSLNEMVSFLFHLLFPSAKIDGYVTEKLNDNEAEQIFRYGEILVNQLNCLKTERDPLIEGLWMEIEKALVRLAISSFRSSIDFFL